MKTFNWSLLLKTFSHHHHNSYYYIYQCKKFSSNPNSRIHLNTKKNEELHTNPNSNLKSVWNPMKEEDAFSVREMVSIKDLFNANVHLGHNYGTLNEFMRPYIFGARLSHLIFDLDQTLPHLHQALNFCAHMAYRGGLILMICQYPRFIHKVESLALECGEYSHCRQWLNGTLTGSKRIFRQEVRLPDLVIFFNTHFTFLLPHEATIECARMGIPTIGVCDSNSDPRLITYKIPGNDDSESAMELYCNAFKKAILCGKMKAKNNKEHF